MRSRKRKLVYFKKIPVRVDLEQWQRLDKIRADYHFKKHIRDYAVHFRLLSPGC